MKLKTDNEKINLMIEASLESIAYRQDKYKSGGIPESDPRVKGGGYYSNDREPRVFSINRVVPFLLEFGEVERVRKLINFWKMTQSKKGIWPRSLSADKPTPLTEAEETDYLSGKSLVQTDKMGYVLWDCGLYYEYTRDNFWLRENYLMIQKAADYLINYQFNEKYKLLYGSEEIIADSIASPKGYFMHINSVCAAGLKEASRLGKYYGNEKSSLKWLNYAQRIEKGIEENLWDKENKRYYVGINEDGKYYSTAEEMCLRPIYYHRRGKWDKRMDSTFWYLREKMYNKDPKIPFSYWKGELPVPIEEISQTTYTAYNGFGPWPQVSCMVATCSLVAGYPEIAAEQINIATTFTPEHNLFPEHINTLHGGKEGKRLKEQGAILGTIIYDTYPEGSNYSVDPGCLFSLSEFVELVLFLIGKEENARVIKLRPKLPNNMHKIEVKKLKVKEALISFDYQTDMPSEHGKTILSIKADRTIKFTLSLRCQLPLKKVTINGGEISDHKETTSFSGKVNYAEVDVAAGEGKKKIEVEW